MEGPGEHGGLGSVGKREEAGSQGSEGAWGARGAWCPRSPGSARNPGSPSSPVSLAPQASQVPLTSQALHAPLTKACAAREPLKPEVQVSLERGGSLENVWSVGSPRSPGYTDSLPRLPWNMGKAHLATPRLL